MKIVQRLAGSGKGRRPVCLAAGFFDGVHLGHRKVLERTVARARALGGEAWVLTFAAHPMKVLRPGLAPRLLTSNAHKVRLFRALGFDGCLLLPFTRSVATRPPLAFLDDLASAFPRLAGIHVGADWRFGHGGSGDTALLRRWARDRGVRVEVVLSLRRGGRPVSSTRIRLAIARGRLAEAAAMLGRPFSLLATVVPGRRIGRTLGYPTANLAPHNEVCPPMGVYAVRAVYRGRAYDAVLNYGHRPTLSERRGAPVLEAHLLDCRASMYREDMEVHFMARLRGERRYPDAAALARQIGTDAAGARRLLATPTAQKLWKSALQARGSTL